MKLLLIPVLALLSLSLPAGGGDKYKEGLELFRQKKYEAATQAFKEALAKQPDNPELSYNLALALWRAGKPDEAETAAEKAASLSKGRLNALRDGILGNLRFDSALALSRQKPGMDPAQAGQSLEQAIAMAGQARGHFQRGALLALGKDPGQGTELLRNLERAIKLEAELKKRKEEAEKKQDDKKQDDKKDQEKDQKGKPEPDPKQKPEEQKPPKKQQVPGEYDPDQELTPEQKKQLLKKLEQMLKELQKLRALQKENRPKVKKDW